MKIDISPTAELEAAERERIDHWLSEVLGTDDYEWSDLDWHVLVRVHDKVVSHVGIIERVATVGGKRVKLGGIGNVATVPEWRGHGLASAALEEAGAFMCNTLGVEFGLLVCADDTVPFYRNLGWEVVEGPLVFDQSSGKVTFPDVTMVLSCRGERWPKGTIDLCGLPW